MPKAPSAETVRERAHHRALATVAAIKEPVHESVVMPDAEAVPASTEVTAGDASAQTRVGGDADIFGEVHYGNEETPLYPDTRETETEETQPAEAEEPKPKRTYRTKAAIEAEARETIKQADAVVAAAAPKQPDTRRQPGEDFLEYQARVSPNDWSSGLIYGNYVYKILAQGKKKRIGDEPIKRPLTMADLKEIVGENGPGSYLVQFQTSLKYLTPCSETFSFDDEGKATSGVGFSKPDPEGLAYSAKVAADITKDAAREGLAMVREERQERNRQPDIAGMFGAMASVFANLIPKPTPPDNTMIQILITDAQRRADAAEKDADRREQRAKDESDKRERDAERRATEAKAEADRQRERDKEFFGLMLKQSESKADSLNQMTGLLTSFMKVKETIDDTMGGGPKGPWDLVGNALDGVMQHGPAIVAAMKGATPQQVQQMQQQANPEPTPAPVETPQQQFGELVRRIALYCRRDDTKWNEEYIGEMVQEEYAGLGAELFENEPKEQIIRAFELTPPFNAEGKSILLAHPSGPAFIEKLIAWFKAEEPVEDEGEPAEQAVILHGKARKVNGKAKAVA